MFGQLLYRFVHTSSIRFNSTVPKTALSALRKKTGYSFVNCKNALLQFDNDLEKAEDWLHAEAQKQGWQKAEKLKGRETKQGLVGFIKRENVAAVVEINCETDFAAKSSLFNDLMKDVLIICHNHALNKEITDSLVKLNISSSDLNSLPWQEGKTLADRLALSVVKIGENLNARRALCLKFKDGLTLTGYAHPANQDLDESFFQTGKYVGVVIYRQLSNSVPPLEFDKSICQHIIGMDPKEIGEMDSVKEDLSDEAQNENTEENKKDSSSDSSSSDDDESIESEMFEERSLVKQIYISDPEKTVGEILEQASVQVIDFVRFECGQQVTEEDKT